jgi:hypothetical protein
VRGVVANTIPVRLTHRRTSLLDGGRQETTAPTC